MQGDIHLQFQGSPRGIYGGHSGIGADFFLKKFGIPFPVIILPTVGACRLMWGYSNEGLSPNTAKDMFYHDGESDGLRIRVRVDDRHKFIYFLLFNDAVSLSVIGEYWIGKDLKERGRGLFEELSRKLPVTTK
jgi:hypothetical protein